MNRKKDRQSKKMVREKKRVKEIKLEKGVQKNVL